MAISQPTADRLNSGVMEAVTRNIQGEVPASTVTDIAYDFFGKRLASASSDCTVRIRDLDEKGEWQLEDGCEIIDAHKALICKVCWAHPTFGQVLSTCSYDGTVKIWEEQIKSQAGTRRRSSPRWPCQATISSARTVVNDVKFAPKHLGMKLATGSGDGRVRIYDVTGPPSLREWCLQCHFVPDGGQMQAGGVLCLAWCKCHFDCPMLIVGTMNGKVQIWRTDSSWSWHKILDLSEHKSRPVTGVDWACDMGRPFYNVASCGADGKVQVHRLSKQRSDWATGDVEVRCVRSFELQNDHKSDTESNAVGVEFDRTGTVLKTSSDDCIVRLWQRDYKGFWTRVDGIYDKTGDEEASGGGDGNAAGTVTEEK